VYADFNETVLQTWGGRGVGIITGLCKHTAASTGVILPDSQLFLYSSALVLPCELRTSVWGQCHSSLSSSDLDFFTVTSHKLLCCRKWPRCPTTLWASTACYRDSFNFLLFPRWYWVDQIRGRWGYVARMEEMRNIRKDALRHEGVWGSGCIDPHFLELGISWSWLVSFTPLPLYPQGKSPRYPLNRSLDGPQSRSGRCGEEKILTLPGLELRPFGRPARRQSLCRLRRILVEMYKKYHLWYLDTDGSIILKCILQKQVGGLFFWLKIGTNQSRLWIVLTFPVR
jgi:hypothetical protein